MTVKELRAALFAIKDQDLQVMVDDASWPGPTRVLGGVYFAEVEVVKDSLSHGNSTVLVDQDHEDKNIVVDGVAIRHVVLLS
jgi:hypothetical protein